MAATDPLSLVFSALADPTRRAMLERLSEGEATVGQLAEPFPISLPAISRHLKVLEQAGLIERGQRAQWRTSALRAQPLENATGWMESVTRLWGERLDRLDAHLDFMKRQLAAQQRQAGAAATPTGEPTPTGGESTPTGGDSSPTGGESTPTGGDASPTGEPTTAGGDSSPAGTDPIPQTHKDDSDV